MAKNVKNEVPETETEETSRSKVSTFSYVSADGETSKNVNGSSRAIRVKFQNGFEDTISLDDVAEDILVCASLQGLAIKLQRSFASVKGDADKAQEAYETVKENLLAGVWAMKGEGSAPRLTILAEAVAAVLTAAGREPDMKAIGEKLKDEATSEKAMKDPKVKAEYDRIKAERAAAKAAKSAEAAGNAESDVSDMF